MITQLFYGKYRGKVTDNRDPLMQGRVRAKVPAVFGEEETGWALPCAPYAGSGVGFFFVPPVDANVWIEFEGGDPDYPIWTGGFWGTGEAPVMPALAETKVIKTDTATLKLDDLPGIVGITIETKTGLKIVMNVTGIELSNGAASVKLTPASVSVNNGALEVI
jgi:Type VI secretion system/phage-baseplate injector OB domain